MRINIISEVNYDMPSSNTIELPSAFFCSKLPAQLCEFCIKGIRSIVFEVSSLLRPIIPEAQTDELSSNGLNRDAISAGMMLFVYCVMMENI